MRSPGCQGAAIHSIHQSAAGPFPLMHTYNALDLLETVEDNGNKVASYLKTLPGTEVLTDNHYCYDHNRNRTEKQQIGEADSLTGIIRPDTADPKKRIKVK